MLDLPCGLPLLASGPESHLVPKQLTDREVSPSGKTEPFFLATYQALEEAGILLLQLSIRGSAGAQCTWPHSGGARLLSSLGLSSATCFG